MPADYLVSTLEAGLTEAGIGPAEVSAAEIYQLLPEETTAVIDEMVAGSQFPMVLVGDRVVCTGGVDLQVIIGAALPA